MLISIKIDNDSVAKKVLWFLKHLKGDGVTILQDSDVKSQFQIQPTQYTDEYVERNWKELAYNASGNPKQDDDEVLKEEYGKYLNEKHNI